MCCTYVTRTATQQNDREHSMQTKKIRTLCKEELAQSLRAGVRVVAPQWRSERRYTLLDAYGYPIRGGNGSGVWLNNKEDICRKSAGEMRKVKLVIPMRTIELRVDLAGVKGDCNVRVAKHNHNYVIA